MKRTIFSNRMLAVACAVAALMFSQIVPKSVATNRTVPAATMGDADISAEIRTLDSFLTELSRFDRKNNELRQKDNLTGQDLAAQERTANSLKLRITEIQNALRDTIRKLKASGQWDNLDQIVLGKLSDRRAQDFVRQEGFKSLLETTASGASSDAAEIDKPLGSLRSRVRAQLQNQYGPENAALFVKASFSAPLMSTKSLRCRLSLLREGLSSGFSNTGSASKEARDAVDCHCFDLGPGCAPTS